MLGVTWKDTENKTVMSLYKAVMQPNLEQYAQLSFYNQIDTVPLEKDNQNNPGLEVPSICETWGYLIGGI